MKKGKLKIVDHYIHQGNQFYFASVGHEIYLMGADSKIPKWNTDHRPLPSNVILITEKEALTKKFDIVMIRSPINPKRYEPFMRKGAIPVAAVQTTNPYPLSPKVKHVVWNCSDTMRKFSKAYYPGKNHFHIVHGFDPDEFKDLELERQSRVLTVANAFKKRSEIMGYDFWKEVNKNLKVCDIFGHDNENIDPEIRQADTFTELLKIYNSYQVFLNTTVDSAMPRSRGEAAMCGTAIVSTKNHSIENYFKGGRDILYANSASEMTEAIKKLLANPSLAAEIGYNGKLAALEHFHIKDYAQKWNSVFGNL